MRLLIARNKIHRLLWNTLKVWALVNVETENILKTINTAN